jgi:hypothetical protein
MIQKVNIKTIKENQNNPRYINKAKFKKLVNSIKSFPEMLEKRPIVVDETMTVLGGNMRLKACKSAGLFEVYIDQVLDWSEEQKKEFIIKDNSSFGEWDWDILGNEWSDLPLNDWGVNVVKYDYDDSEIENFFSENSDSNVESSKFKISFEFSQEDGLKVQEALLKVDEKLEKALWKLLKLNEQ